MKICAVIPTLNRRNDLNILFESLLTQNEKFHKIVIVDGSGSTAKNLINKYKDKLNLVYCEVFPPSLSKQRNVGVDALDGDYDYVGFLDDDLEFLEGVNEKLFSFLKQNNVGGVSLNLINQSPKKSTFNKLFLHDGGENESGLILESGIPSPIYPVGKIVKTQWLYGGATFWKKDVFEKTSYDEWYVGYGYGEDVDFSYGVYRHGFDLCMLSDIGVYHHHVSPKATYSKMFVYGKQQIVNRSYFLKKYDLWNGYKTYWAMFGYVLRGFLTFVIRFNFSSLGRFVGSLSGIYHLIFKRNEKFYGMFK